MPPRALMLTLGLLLFAFFTKIYLHNRNITKLYELQALENTATALQEKLENTRIALATQENKSTLLQHATTLGYTAPEHSAVVSLPKG